MTRLAIAALAVAAAVSLAACQQADPGIVSVTGRVVAVAFANGAPTLTIETAEGRTIAGLPLGNVSQIRETQ